MKPLKMQRQTPGSEILPEFPKIPHLPWKPNFGDDDEIASIDKADEIFSKKLIIEEKVDGASVGIALFEDHPIIRNRTRVMKKGRVAKTPAGTQFASIWNWFYKNIVKFSTLNRIYGQPLSVYGDWMFMQHGMEYDRLPDYFIPYNLYSSEERKMLSSKSSRQLLSEVGFAIPQLVGTSVSSYEELDELVIGPSLFSSKANREGLVIKLDSADILKNSYKIVREDFVQGALFDPPKYNKLQ